MTKTIETLETLIELAPDSLGGGEEEWAEYLESVEPLDPEDLPGEILIGNGFYGRDILDGVHRIAGMAIWASENDIEDDDIDVAVTELNRDESKRWATEHAR